MHGQGVRLRAQQLLTAGVPLAPCRYPARKSAADQLPEMLLASLQSQIDRFKLFVELPEWSIQRHHERLDGGSEPS